MDSTLECVTDWIMRQRWYTGKGRVPLLRRIGAWDSASDDPSVRVRTLLVMDDAAHPAVLYQVPVTLRTGLLPGGGRHLIGRIDTGEYLYDGPNDPAYQQALLRMIALRQSATPDGANAVGEFSGPDALSRALADGGFAASATVPVTILPTGAVPASVIAGEQSNTSIVYRPKGATPVICKIYRQLHHGENPDVVLQTALAQAGSPFVPASIGDVMASWSDAGRPSGQATGHVAFAQEFLPDVEDAWKLALRAAAAGEDFAVSALELGEATAAVHLALRELFPLTPATPGHIAGVALGWHQRLGVALGEVPLVADYRSEIVEAYDAAQAGPWPELQRIHGDLHLGQVLHVPGRGWVVLDFEGEPMRPMAERSRLDLPVRDVAGMLRSFDYVAGSIALEHPDVDRDALEAWALAARQAFLEGYVRGSGMDLTGYRELLEAFELDKAVYEAVYEMRNRPDWAGIPLRGIEHLLATGPMSVT